MLRDLIIVLSIAGLLAGCQNLPSGSRANSLIDGGIATQQAELALVQTEGGPSGQGQESTDTAIEQPQLPANDLWERIRRDLSWQDLDNTQITQARNRYLKQHNYLEVVLICFPALKTILDTNEFNFSSLYDTLHGILSYFLCHT